MTLTATYNIPKCVWTDAIDTGLAAWSQYIQGDAQFKIRVDFDDTMSYLATCRTVDPLFIGNISGDKKLYIPRALATLQKVIYNDYDFIITWNRTFPWHHGSGTVGGQYTSWQTATHELGHALFAVKFFGSMVTPYHLWADKQPPGSVNDSHVNTTDSIMYPSAPMASSRSITPFDLSLAASCGIPLKTQNCNIIVAPGGIVEGGTGTNTAVWYGSFSDYNATIRNISTLEMVSPTALNTEQVKMYKLYRAAFARVPDINGFKWWNSQNIPFEQKAALLMTTNEYVTKYGDNLPHKDYVIKLYTNILGRTPREDEVAYWLTRTDMSKLDLLLFFSVGAPENTITKVIFTG